VLAFLLRDFVGDLMFDLQNQYFIFKLQNRITYLLAGVLVCVILGVLRFGRVLKHLLSILLSLEFLVLIIFSLIVLHFYILREGTYVAIIFLIFRVCEGALGLTMLVSIARRFGGDYIRSLRLAA